MIVVDTNIISYFYLPTDQTRWAEQLLEQEPTWAVPMLWRSEFRNVLAFYMRKKIIDLETALTLQQEAEELLHDHEFEIPSLKVLSLVSQSSCSAYDCEFVGVAQLLNTRLVTEDKKILKEFPETAYSLKAFLNE
jgi:predicted nucleic acid-binding protein